MIILLANDPYSLYFKQVLFHVFVQCTHVTFSFFVAIIQTASIYNLISSRRKPKTFIQIYQFSNF